MDADRWRRIETLYHNTLAKPANERAAYLASLDEDDDIRSEVESLLEANERDDQFKATALVADVARDLVRTTAQTLASERSAVIGLPGVGGLGEVYRAPGSRIGPYEISAVIGTGGMGVVYKAWDDRLRRDVAIKTLKTDSEDTTRRFLREAQTASALNHPNIVTIYDIGTTDTGGPYIAMEYIAGTTLRDLLSRGRLDTSAVLRYSIQLAAALAKAHAASIIHRDLKPANVIVTDDGTLKVLDFGLAKALQTASDDEAATTALSISGPLAIMGTVPYMSPEQAKGEKVDQRTDIFSFGVILHEMATARHPFQHNTTAATLAAILHSDVTFPARGASPAAQALEDIITRCLVKDREKRYQTIELVRQDLEKVQKLLVPSGRRLRLTPLLAAAAAVLVGVAGWRLIPDRPAPEPVPVPAPVTTYQGDELQPHLSPDGDRVAFSWNGETQDNFDIYVKLLDSGPPLRLTTDPADDSNPSWSPDGRSIAFLRGRAEQAGTVFVLPALGGPERKVTTIRVPTAFFPGRALTWTPDGKWLACGCGENGTLIVISVETGTKRPLTRANEFPGSRADINPEFSSDGARLAFARFLGGPGEIFVLPLNDDYSARGTAQQLTFDKRVAFGPTWLSDTDLLFVAGPSIPEQRLWRMSVSGNQRATSLGSLGDNVGNATTAHPQNGSGARVVYERRSFDTNIWRLDLAAGSSGSLSRVESSSADDNDPQLSPDGNQLLFGSNRSGRYEVWVSDPRGGHARTLLGAAAGGARWSADGSEIVYESQESGRHIAIGDRDGTGRHRLEAIQDGVVPSFSRDGRWIYFSSNAMRTEEFRVWKIGHPARGTDSSKLVQVTKRQGSYSEESHDGAYVYFASSFGTGSIWRVPSTGGKEELVIDEPVHWSNFTVAADGIYYIAVPPTGSGVSSHLYGAPGNALKFFRFSDRKTLIIHALPHPAYMGLSVSRDQSQVFLTQVDHQGSDLWMVDGLR